MKNLLLILLIFPFSCLGCSDKNENENVNGECSFSESEVIVDNSSGTKKISAVWAYSEWEITTDSEGFITNITPNKGGNVDFQSRTTTITFDYSSNPLSTERTQDIFITDKKTRKQDKITIIQTASSSNAEITVDTSIKYQKVVGFGGMYNPVIWLKSNLITSDEIIRMYSPEGLGYNILRLMIYPKESDWAADVQGAKLAQKYGATIFACPWDCTEALSEKITVNNKEYKHLKKENYKAYANHLVKYINFMKDNGVNIYAISVQNEPDMDFTYWYPQEVVEFVKVYGDLIRATGVKLMSPEACGMQPEYTDPILNDSEAFGNTDILAGHLYQGFTNLTSNYVKNRHDYICGLYNKKLASAGKTWWMTEHLFNEGEKETDQSLWKFRQWNYNLETLGKEIHMCMEGYCSAYIYWYLKRFYGMIGDNDDRSLEDKGGKTLKNGYIMSHYAKYVNGRQRIQVSKLENNNDILITAYSGQNDITLIIINNGNTTVNGLKINIPNTAKNCEAIETSENENMVKKDIVFNSDKKSATIPLSAKSIVSVKFDL